MKKRTKKEKMRTQERRKEHTAVQGVNYHRVSGVKEATLSPVAAKRVTASDLFKYDIRLIQKDLMRTVSVTIIVVSILLSVFFYLK